MKRAAYQNILAILMVLLMTFPAPVMVGQTGGTYDLSHNVVAGGGGSNSVGGTFMVSGTAGQAAAGALSTGGQFSLAGGFWNINPFAGFGLEADVAPRNSGDGFVLSSDVVQVKRFQVGLDQPTESNELQRGDSAPFASKGDNLIQAADVIQTRLYQIGLNPLQTAGGPGAFYEPAPQFEKPERPLVEIKPAPVKADLGPITRRLFIQNATGMRGQQVDVFVLADAVGDEAGYGFRVGYDPAILSHVSNGTVPPPGAGGFGFCNATVAGQVTCSVDTFPNDQPGSSTTFIGEMLPGLNQQLLRIRFTVASMAPIGLTPITLTGVNASNDAAANLAITSAAGNFNVTGPTAAEVSITGRVLTADGQGIRNVRLTLTALDGTRRTVTTGSFGYYAFDGVEVGQTYVLEVASKRYTFANTTRVLNLQDHVSGLDFTAEPQ